jgi:hypothetical protein
MHTFPILYSDTAVSLFVDVHTYAFTGPTVTERGPAITTKCAIERCFSPLRFSQFTSLTKQLTDNYLPNKQTKQPTITN